MARAIFCTILFFMLIGCSASDPLIGSWTMRTDPSAAEMVLAQDSSLHYGDNSGTWQKVDNRTVILKMASGVYTAEVRENILSFSIDGTDVVFVKKK